VYLNFVSGDSMKRPAYDEGILKWMFFDKKSPAALCFVSDGVCVGFVPIFIEKDGSLTMGTALGKFKQPNCDTLRKLVSIEAIIEIVAMDMAKYLTQEARYYIRSLEIPESLVAQAIVATGKQMQIADTAPREE